MRPAPVSGTRVRVRTSGSPEATASGRGEATAKHGTVSSVSSPLSWVRAPPQCGCLVTRVLSSGGLHDQEVKSLPGVASLGFLLGQDLTKASLGGRCSTPLPPRHAYTQKCQHGPPLSPGEDWVQPGPGPEEPELGSELVPDPHQGCDPDKHVLSGPPQGPHVHRAGHRSIYFTGRQSSHLRTPVVPGTRGPGSRGLGLQT